MFKALQISHYIHRKENRMDNPIMDNREAQETLGTRPKKKTHTTQKQNKKTNKQTISLYPRLYDILLDI